MFISGKTEHRNTRYIKIVNKSFENLDRVSTKPNFVHADIKSRQITFREYLLSFGTESLIFPTVI
jgi:hypothetical protein